MFACPACGIIFLVIAMINESNINCFLTLAETLSFTKTSQLLYFTQQGVSKSIRQLEADLGFPLFARSGKNIELTKDGQRCYELLREFKETFSQEISEMQKNYARSAYMLNVGFQNFLELTDRLNQAHTQFCAANENYSIRNFRYSPGMLITLLSRMELDVIVMFERFASADANVCIEPLFPVPATILWSKNSERFSEDTKFEDVINAPYLADIFENETPASFDTRIKTELSTCQLSPNKIITLPNRDSTYTAAVLGEGVMLGSEISASSRANHLQKIRAGYNEVVSCIWSKSNPHQDTIRKYVAVLKQVYHSFKFE